MPPSRKADQGANRLLAADIRDVDAFDLVRVAAQVQGFSEGCRQGFPGLLFPVLFRKNLGGVLAGHGHELQAWTPLRYLQPDRGLAQFRQPLLQQDGIFRLQRQQQFGWRLSFRGIILDNGLCQDGLVRAERIGEEKGLGAGDHAGPDKEDGDSYRGVMARQAEDILVPGMFGGDDLPLQGVLQSPELIPEQRRFLKAQVPGCRLHFLLQRLCQLLVASLQHHEHPLDHGLVGLGVDRHGAGPQAVAELKIQTWPVAGSDLGAAAQGEEGLQQPDGFPHGGDRGIGPEIAAAVPDASAGDRDPWPFILDRDLDQRIVLVIAQDDVVAGPVLFDERGLEDQGLFLGGGEDGFNAPSVTEHNPGP